MCSFLGFLVRHHILNMALQETHLLIWRLLLLTISRLLRFPIAILELNWLRHKHLRLELKLVRVQQPEL